MKKGREKKHGALWGAGMLLGMVAAPSVALPCTPSDTHLCVSVGGAAGAPHFSINGLTNPPLTLCPATTYTFEMDTGDFWHHPFHLSHTPPGGIGSPVALTEEDGVTGEHPADSHDKSFEYHPSAPGTVYYRCTIHSTMGNRIDVVGELQDWTEWSECSAECGGGMRTRSREIVVSAAHDDLNCPEEIQEEEPCLEFACLDDLDCAYTEEWTDWSACSAECGGGVQFRTRTTNAEDDCPDGVGYDERSCNDEPCQDCVVSEWGAWSACEDEERTRTRTVITAPDPGGEPCPELEETQACTVQDTDDHHHDDDGAGHAHDEDDGAEQGAAEEGGCDCSAGSTAGPSLLVFLALLLVRRRRQHA